MNKETGKRATTEKVSHEMPKMCYVQMTLNGEEGKG